VIRFSHEFPEGSQQMSPKKNRSVFLISLVLLAVVAITIGLKPRVAHASEGVLLNGTFTVQAELLTTITTCAPGDTNCAECLNTAGIFVDAHGIGETSLGPLVFQILKCFNPAGGSFGTYAGTFTMAAPNGEDSLTGTYSGQNDNAGDAYGFGPFSGKLTVTHATGKFRGAQGSDTFTAQAGPLTVGPNPNTAMLMAFYSVRGNIVLPNH
jgi:hypothetical protein